jgi:hypothetical protein
MPPGVIPGRWRLGFLPGNLQHIPAAAPPCETTAKRVNINRLGMHLPGAEE